MDESARHWLRQQSENGLKIYFVVYDILPILRPDWFPSYTNPLFRVWFDGVASLSNGLVCISRSVAEQVVDWLDKHPVERPEPLKVGYFHLGADVEAGLTSAGMTGEEEGIVQSLAGRTSDLDGGHHRTQKRVSANARCFRDTVGRGEEHQPGRSWAKKAGQWGSWPGGCGDTARRGKRLFWLEHASDELLAQALWLVLRISDGLGRGGLRSAHRRGSSARPAGDRTGLAGV